MNDISIRLISFEHEGATWLGAIVKFKTLGLSIMLSLNLSTGELVQLSLPGFGR